MGSAVIVLSGEAVFLMVPGLSGKSGRFFMNALGVFLLAAFFLSLRGSWAASPQEAARTMMKEYIRLEASYSEKMVELYDDTASIRNVRTYANGVQHQIDLPGATYKQLIQKVLPLARQRGESSRYKEIQYETVSGERVRVTAIRRALPKGYDSPIAWVVGPNAQGRWVIWEEVSESRQK
jgi:hypothetical protein